VRIPAPPARPWELKAEEVELVKGALCRGATDAELAFCLATARRYRLDPFRGQIWFVPRRDASAPSGKRWIPIVGINGLLHIAARDHRSFGSYSDVEYGPLHEVKYQENGKGPVLKLTAPEWARAATTKRGSSEATTSTVYWDEIYAEIDYSPMVRKMPRLMLAKCARAAVTRTAYPATDGLYIREEFAGRPEFTPEGRAIEYARTDDGRTLDLPPVEADPDVANYLARLTPDERAAEEAAMKRHSEHTVRVETRSAAEAGKSADTSGKPARAAKGSVVFIIEYPGREDGDVVVTASAEIVALLELRRVPAAVKEGEENHRLVKYAALTKFYDRCRDCGVEVRDLTENAKR